jgi:hypothetical protein
MRHASFRFAATIVLLVAASVVSAQTADEIIEKSVAAMGGRQALTKIKSRSATGAIVLSTPAGDITGSVELLNAAPNKSRSVIKADLSALGAGQLIIDQRFDGHAGYVLDSLQGNRDITGNQLDNLKNGSFPHPYLNYKDLGIGAKITGKDKVGDRDAYVILFDPASGSEVRNFIDAETFLPIKVVIKVDLPQIGEIEQSNDLLDYREVDGIRVPFRVRASSSVQNYTITLDKVQHNVTVDEALFSKPAQ